MEDLETVPSAEHDSDFSDAEEGAGDMDAELEAALNIEF
jgi:hypothetical protein